MSVNHRRGERESSEANLSSLTGSSQSEEASPSIIDQVLDKSRLVANNVDYFVVQEDPPNVSARMSGEVLSLNAAETDELLRRIGIDVDAINQKRAAIKIAEQEIKDAEVMVSQNFGNIEYVEELRLAKKKLNDILDQDRNFMVVPEQGLADYSRYKEETPVVLDPEILKSSGPLENTGNTIYKHVDKDGQSWELIEGKWVKIQESYICDDRINEYQP
jgi:hypothetical protein